MKGSIIPLLRFSALIILFQENISLRCKRSCLRLVKKLTGEFIRVNELYFLIEYKILLSKRNTKMLFHWLLYNRPHPSFVWQKVGHKSRKASQGSQTFFRYRYQWIFQTYFYGIKAGSQLSMFSLNCRRSLNQFFNSKIPK